MRQAIITKYIGPTNHRGSRIKVTANAGTMTVSWDHSLDVEANHRDAARQFAAKYQWVGRWFGGALPNRLGGYCFVNLPSAEYLKTTSFRIAKK